MKVAVFQRGKRAQHIIEGLKKFGDLEVEVFSVTENLPQIIEEPENYIQRNIDADLIVDHLHHGDLTDFLVEVANEKDIPIVVPYKRVKGALTPPTCCSLNLKGFKFGYPKFKVEIEGDTISDIEVLKGAPCGATWLAAEKIKGLKIDEAVTRIALEVQYICKGSGGYNILGKKAPLHVAGHVHQKALKKATGRN
jgi:hypothetical protein